MSIEPLPPSLPPSLLSFLFPSLPPFLPPFQVEMFSDRYCQGDATLIPHGRCLRLGFDEWQVMPVIPDSNRVRTVPSLRREAEKERIGRGRTGENNCKSLKQGDEIMQGESLYFKCSCRRCVSPLCTTSDCVHCGKFVRLLPPVTNLTSPLVLTHHDSPSSSLRKLFSPLSFIAFLSEFDFCVAISGVRLWFLQSPCSLFREPVASFQSHFSASTSDGSQMVSMPLHTNRFTSVPLPIPGVTHKLILISVPLQVSGVTFKPPQNWLPTLHCGFFLRKGCAPDSEFPGPTRSSL
eukprot:1805935-Rhodomonas_salina.1